jgi:hypothetical protein
MLIHVRYYVSRISASQGYGTFIVWLTLCSITWTGYLRASEAQGLISSILIRNGTQVTGSRNFGCLRGWLGVNSISCSRHIHYYCLRGRDFIRSCRIRSLWPISNNRTYDPRDISNLPNLSYRRQQRGCPHKFLSSEIRLCQTQATRNVSGPGFAQTLDEGKIVHFATADTAFIEYGATIFRHTPTTKTRPIIDGLLKM